MLPASRRGSRPRAVAMYVKKTAAPADTPAPMPSFAAGDGICISHLCSICCSWVWRRRRRPSAGSSGNGVGACTTGASSAARGASCAAARWRRVPRGVGGVFFTEQRARAGPSAHELALAAAAAVRWPYAALMALPCQNPEGNGNPGQGNVIPGLLSRA